MARRKLAPKKRPAKRAASGPRSISKRGRPTQSPKPCSARNDSGKRCLLRAGHKGRHDFPTPSYLQLPARWHRYYINKATAFEEEGDPLEAGLLERKRLLEIDYLRESIKLLRKHVDGFEARDGFDLNKIVNIPDSRLNKVREYAPLIREEIAQPHIIVRPRTKEARAAIQRHTGQRDIPKRKAFVVFTPSPDHTTARIVRAKRVVKDSRGYRRTIVDATVELTRSVRGGKVTDRFFYLPDPPTSFDDIITQTRKMLRFMPRGWYTLVTSTHGNIAVPMRKEQILQQLHDRYMIYDKVPSRSTKDNRGLAEVVIGYKLISFTEEGAAQEYNERLSSREIAQRFRQQQRAKQRRRALRKLTGYM